MRYLLFVDEIILASDSKKKFMIVWASLNECAKEN